MIAQELEVTLHQAFVEARKKRHELITVAHLLLALLNNPTAAEVLHACGANLDELRKLLTRFIAENTRQAASDLEADTQPAPAFQRTIQRAILHVQSSGKKEVTGADVLVAIFGEKDSHAVGCLQQQSITRRELAVFVSHGAKATKRANKPEADDDTSDVQVVLYNDDFTPMEFVVRVLQDFFTMDRQEATEAMLEVHRNGKAVCGLYSREAGEAVVKEVLAFASKHGHPLHCAAEVSK